MKFIKFVILISLLIQIAIVSSKKRRRGSQCGPQTPCKEANKTCCVIFRADGQVSSGICEPKIKGKLLCPDVTRPVPLQYAYAQ